MRFAPAFLFFLALTSCAPSREKLIGIYRPAKNSATRLTLKDNGEFELALLDPKIDTIQFKKHPAVNSFLEGAWTLSGKKTVVLTTKPGLSAAGTISDSISRFTNISSFNFWNRYGEPVPIRYILIPPGRPKPHYGNSLYFFAQDFAGKDTIQFYFEGFSSINYPGRIPGAIGNNIHKITLTEAYDPALFDELKLQVHGNRLSSAAIYFEKKK